MLILFYECHSVQVNEKFVLFYACLLPKAVIFNNRYTHTLQKKKETREVTMTLVTQPSSESAIESDENSRRASSPPAAAIILSHT